MTQKSIVFMDRDGVINIDTGYPHKIEEFLFNKGIFSSAKYLIKLGYEIIIVTNQSGIGRGYFQLEDFIILNNWMLNQFKKNKIEILDVFYCPHSPDDDCFCRKPKPGLFKQALRKYNIDVKKSWMIGDKFDDIIAANYAGIENNILITSKKEIIKPIKITKNIINSISLIDQIIKY